MFRRSLLAAPLLAVVGCAQRNAVPTTDTVVVFFTADSAALDDGARNSIQQAAEFARNRPNTSVHVRGFSAPDAGSPAFNQSLANTRANAVVDALVTAGVQRIRISLESRGAVPYELMPTESRRVSIVIG